MLGEEFYARMAREREAIAAKYCKKCGGSGFDLTKPQQCKNCKGTTVRGTGKCHKCEMALAPDYKPVAVGLTFNVCPDCHGPDYTFRHVSDVLDTNVGRPVPSWHEHGTGDVRCMRPKKATDRVD